MPILLIYFLFFLCAFLLGFFGLAPIIILDLLSDKMPYIILVILGYTTLIVLFVLWQTGYLSKLQNKVKNEETDTQEGLEIENISPKLNEDQELETIKESEEDIEVETFRELDQEKKDIIEEEEAFVEGAEIKTIQHIEKYEETISVEGNQDQEGKDETLDSPDVL